MYLHLAPPDVRTATAFRLKVDLCGRDELKTVRNDQFFFHSYLAGAVWSGRLVGRSANEPRLNAGDRVPL